MFAVFFAVLSGARATLAGDGGPPEIEARVRAVLPDGRIECEGMPPIRLFGTDPRAAAPAIPGAKGPLAVALDRVLDREAPVRIRRFGEPGAPDAPDAPAIVSQGSRSLNETVLRSGDALYFPEFGSREGSDVLAAAAREALEARRGILADSKCGPRPPQDERKAGVALPMFGHTGDFDYRSRVDEIAALGAGWISLVPFHFLETIRDVEIVAAPGRTPWDETLVRTGQYARSKGLRVFVLPIVHLLRPGAHEWRGAFEPKGDRRREFFLNYTRFITHQADLARRMGADLFSIGSELIRLEDDEAAWRVVIEACRARFPGLLTYSANWDHYRNIAWWDSLDVVGLTGYYTIATVDDPTKNDLRAGWRVPKRRLLDFLGQKGKTAIFTELGYPSRDGAAQAPWDYVTTTRYDGDEQADCLAAFFDEFRGERAVSGVFVYDWWDEGGPGDVSYSPRGKPAERVVKDGLSAFRADAGAGGSER